MYQRRSRPTVYVISLPVSIVAHHRGVDGGTCRGIEISPGHGGALYVSQTPSAGRLASVSFTHHRLRSAIDDDAPRPPPQIGAAVGRSPALIGAN